MPNQSHDELIAELRTAFDQCDADADNLIQYAEFVALLDNLEAGMSKEDVRIGFDEIDTDDDGVIDFDEFLAWWTEP